MELPEGLQRFTKTNQIKKNSFNKIREWWNNREENEQAWKVNIKDLINYNLDIKNPNKIDETEDLTSQDILEKMEQLNKRNNEIISGIKDLLK